MAGEEPRDKMAISHHSSNLSFGRAFRAGKLPTIPALHCAITRSGFDMMNSGAPITGIRSFDARCAMFVVKKFSLL